MTSKRLFIGAGSVTFAVALFQLVLTFSPLLSKTFGAPEIVYTNPTILYASSLFITALFVVSGLYAFSGAGTIRPLPLLRTGLIVIGTVFTVRGLAFIPEFLIIAGYLEMEISVTPQVTAVSLISLVLGVAYLAGVMGQTQQNQRD